MNTSIVLDKPGDLIPQQDTLEMMWKMAQRVVKSGLAGYKATPDSVLAVAMTGRELGLPFMASVRGVNVIEGKPSPSAALVAALIYKAHGDNAIRITKSTADECVIRYRRKGWPEGESEELSLTMEEAHLAEWHKNRNGSVKENWTKFPKAMLRSRAITMVGQDAFPDVVLGLYTPDELDSSEVHVEDITDDIQAGPSTSTSVHRRDSADADGGTDRMATEEGEEETPSPMVDEAEEEGLDEPEDQQLDVEVDTETGEIVEGEYEELAEPDVRSDLPGRGRDFFNALRDLSNLYNEPIDQHHDMFAACETAEDELKVALKAIQSKLHGLIVFTDTTDKDAQMKLNELWQGWNKHRAWTPKVQQNWQVAMNKAKEAAA